MKRRLILMGVMSIFFASCLRLPVKADDFRGEIPNAVNLEKGLIGGGTPSDQALRVAADKGIKTVIDLRLPEEGTEKEKVLVEKEGLIYINIPTSAENLNRSQADKLNEVLSRENSRPAILHCASGNRAAAVWAVYRHFHKGMPAPKALAEASEKGLKPGFKDKLAAVLAAES